MASDASTQQQTAAYQRHYGPRAGRLVAVAARHGPAALSRVLRGLRRLRGSR